MRLYLRKVKELLEKFHSVGVEQIPRLEIAKVAVLAKLASGIDIENPDRVPIEWLQKSAIENTNETCNIEANRCADWRTPLVKFLKKRKAPKQPE